MASKARLPLACAKVKTLLFNHLLASDILAGEMQPFPLYGESKNKILLITP